MAIDRNTVSKLGEYGYAPPTDAIGLNGLFPQWVTDPTREGAGEALATYNPTAAKKLLTDNGFTYKGNKLIDPKGNPVKLDIHVISGWSDWVASNQIITKNLQGDRHRLERRSSSPTGTRGIPNAFAHEEPDAALAERLAGLAVRVLQREPVAELRSSRRARTRRRPGNWAHTYDATATALLNQWKVTLDPDEAARDRDAAREDLPRAACRSSRSSSGRGGRPTARSTSTASTRRRTSTATRSSRTFPDNILSFTRICPGGKAGA